MKLIKTVDAVGKVLCHDLTQIIVGVTKDARFRKGHIVQEEDIPVLLSMGKEHLYVWEMQEGMLHEDDGARILCEACENAFMERSAIKEGKIELKATTEGVLEIDTARLLAINSLEKVMIATRVNHSVVHIGDKLAGMRVIPLIIESGHMEKVSCIANAENPLLSIHPFSIKDCTLLVTGSEVSKDLIIDTFSPVVEQKLQEVGVAVTKKIYTGDDQSYIRECIKHAVSDGASMVLCTGGMSVDPDDRTPGAIKDSGAKIVTYGSPVLPGAMFLVSFIDEVPVLGLPGCVMYAKRTVFDLALPRIVARIPLTSEDIARWGNGGLCLQCPVCHFPNCNFGMGGI
ncbi:molybdopterin-binding protein [uncultured Sphaerochaeta sp.]|uniref:molybdopterin-binding protein n=1 Tax=uncultured Sphaerochaeta sp. TaxID=886478 RepID=UPI002A0A1846|nr:molybdopterin-binding protein [uncultured Sphaerochaeta sp.]